jgi:thiamine pyrophosphokinase
MHVVVVAGGDVDDGAWARGRLASAALVVAADGGARAALVLGRAPDVVAGDLDSLDPRSRAGLVGAGTVFEVYPREKDETDLEIALRIAVARGATSIDVVGALGGPRFDHALANVMILALDGLGDCQVAIVDPHHEVRLLRGPGLLRLEGRPGDLVTLLPLSETAEGIDTSDLAYALRDGTLRRGRTRGVSNELTATQGTVRLRAGLLYVVLHRVRSGYDVGSTRDREVETDASGAEPAVPQSQPAVGRSEDEDGHDDGDGDGGEEGVRPA